MHLFAAMLPPREVTEELERIVASVQLRTGEPGRHRGRRSLGRLVSRGGATQSLLEPAADQLRPVPWFNMRVDLASFGNLERRDAERLLDVLGAEASRWHAIRLQVSGGTVLEPEGDDSAWATLDGELERLRMVSRGVARAAQGQQLFVDRRRFRPMVRLGRVNELTSVPYLEQLLADLTAFTSQAWTQTTFSVLQGAASLPGEPDFRPYAEIELGER